MKTKMKMLLMAVVMLGMASYPIFMNGGVIRVESNNGNGNNGGNNNTETQFPHLAPPHYSNLASAYWDAVTGVLSVSFYDDADEVTISIYKDDTLVTGTTCSVSMDDVINFNLSSYGSGDYQIVITGMGNDNLYGNFVY